MKLLNPWYITGFVEGEGSFNIIISKHKTKRIGYDARLSFEIELRGDDRSILECIQRQFSCGRIYELKYERYGWNPHVKYSVRKQSDIRNIVIPFFRKYPLFGKKAKDFILFCQAFESVIEYKRHLSEEGIEQLRTIRKYMNDRRPFGE